MGFDSSVSLLIPSTRSRVHHVHVLPFGIATRHLVKREPDVGPSGHQRVADPHVSSRSSSRRFSHPGRVHRLIAIPIVLFGSSGGTTLSGRRRASATRTESVRDLPRREWSSRREPGRHVYAAGYASRLFPLDVRLVPSLSAAWDRVHDEAGAISAHLELRLNSTPSPPISQPRPGLRASPKRGPHQRISPRHQSRDASLRPHGTFSESRPPWLPRAPSCHNGAHHAGPTSWAGVHSEWPKGP